MDMRIVKILLTAAILVFVYGCHPVDRRVSNGDSRPPLINRLDFTNFIPVFVTNEFNREEYDFRLLEIQKD
jgi:hypothetical protein